MGVVRIYQCRSKGEYIKLREIERKLAAAVGLYIPFIDTLASYNDRFDDNRGVDVPLYCIVCT